MEKEPIISNKMPRLLTPDTVYLDITPKCNLCCKHCYSSIGNVKIKEKTYREICKILNELKEAGVFKVYFVGREPLMRKDFKKIIKLAFQKGFFIGIATNGTLITENMARAFSEYGVKNVQISIDSVSSQKHNDFRGNPNAFQSAIRGMELLNKYKIKFSVSTTLMNFNIEELEKIAEFSHDIGAYYYRTRLLIGNQFNKKFQISKEQYKRASELMFNLKNYYKNMTVEQLHHSFLFDKNIKYEPDKNISVSCGAGISRCSLTYDLKITPCIALTHLYSSTIQRDFTKEWQNNNIFNEWLEIFNSIKGKCSYCGYRYICGGGCRANVFGNTNDIHSSDPWCWFNPKP